MNNGSDELDVQSIDVRSLTSQQWAALKRQVVRRAQAERARVIRAMVVGLVGWLRRAPQSNAPIMPRSFASATHYRDA